MDAEEDSGTRAAASDFASRRYLVVGLAGCLLSLLIDDPVRGWLVVAFACGTAVTAVVAVRRDPCRSNPAWFFALGAVLLVPSYTLWYPATLQWDLTWGSPAITDWMFLAAYGSFLVAVAGLNRRRGSGRHRLDVLDTLIVGIGVGAVVWVTFISPYMHDETMSWTARLVAISYTVVNLLLFGAMVRLLVHADQASTGDRLLAGWVVVQLGADLLYAVTTLRGTFSLDFLAIDLYPVSFVLLGAALLHPTTLRPTPLVGARPATMFRRLVVVVPAALMPPAMIAVLGALGGYRQILVVAVLSAVVFSLVLARVWMLVVDNEDHRRTRELLTESIATERRRSEENQELLASLRERQMLSDRLARIQRQISTRAPLQEVLDAITRGAAELVHNEVAALRFLDENDPTHMIMVSSVGVADDVASDVRRLPVTAGVGGRALVSNRLCIQSAYPEWESAIGQFATGGLQTAMAAPVHLGTEPIGSLVVATHQADRSYSLAEQEALIRFAEHVSIALNDANSVRAMNDALERALHQAMHDDLTGLPNRACFYDRAEQALRSARREGGSTAVLLLDLDRFKEINDTLGHRYGDRVLRAIGPRITPLLREADTLARLGGDEFCVLLTRISGLDAAIEVAHRITAALQEPLEVEGMTLVVEASCGVTIGPEHGDTADLLLQRSDIAMYAAKTSHSSVMSYEHQLDRNTPDRLALVGELRTAIGNDELFLHFQPQIDLVTGQLEGAEALVRWDHPRRGRLDPDVFVPIAEDTGLIHQLTSWVLDAALDQLRQWLDDPAIAIDRDFALAVNLSTQSLLDDSFATEVGVALERFGVPAHQLVLEITETTLMADPDRSQRVLTRLADRGVRFAIDDFGTGYSSLASLKDLPVHDLKIDQSFVRCMHLDADDAVIVRSVIELGHTLGLRTIAEGVENAEIMDRLVALGCDSAQGFSIGRPMAAHALVAWMRARAEPGSFALR